MAVTIATSTAVDLSRVPMPDVVETLDYEKLRQDWVDEFASRYPEYTSFLESDPAIKELEAGAFRELIVRQRVNDAARARMLAYATGADLDAIAVLFGVARREVSPANPATGAPATMEPDEALRLRILLAPDSYSVAGPRLAYVYHALSAHGDVLDANATSPGPGEVIVSVLSRQGNGTASPELLAAVEAVVGADDVRPLTDAVSVQSAQLVEFAVEAKLTLYAGPDPELIRETAQKAVADLLGKHRRIGNDITRSALIAALHGGGVQNVNLVSPAADVVVGETGAAWANSISVTVAGFGE